MNNRIKPTLKSSALHYTYPPNPPHYHRPPPPMMDPSSLAALLLKPAAIFQTDSHWMHLIIISLRPSFPTHSSSTSTSVFPHRCSVLCHCSLLFFLWDCDSAGQYPPCYVNINWPTNQMAGGRSFTDGYLNFLHGLRCENISVISAHRPLTACGRQLRLMGRNQ